MARNDLSDGLYFMKPLLILTFNRFFFQHQQQQHLILHMFALDFKSRLNSKITSQSIISIVYGLFRQVDMGICEYTQQCTPYNSDYDRNRSPQLATWELFNPICTQSKSGFSNSELCFLCRSLPFRIRSQLLLALAMISAWLYFIYSYNPQLIWYLQTNFGFRSTFISLVL